MSLGSATLHDSGVDAGWWSLLYLIPHLHTKGNGLLLPNEVVMVLGALSGNHLTCGKSSTRDNGSFDWNWNYTNNMGQRLTFEGRQWLFSVGLRLLFAQALSGAVCVRANQE